MGIRQMVCQDTRKKVLIQYTLLAYYHILLIFKANMELEIMQLYAEYLLILTATNLHYTDFSIYICPEQ